MKDLSLHWLDILQNSLVAGANRIETEFTVTDACLHFTVSDNGCGMAPEFLQMVESPFTTTRTTRKVGMGIPLLKQNAEMAGGRFSITSEQGRGTSLTAVFTVSHIDRLPLGDIADTFTGVIMSHPDRDFSLRLACGDHEAVIDTAPIREVLGEVPLTNFDVLDFIRNQVNEGLNETFGGVLHEIHR